MEQTRKEKLQEFINLLFGEETEADRLMLDAQERMADIKERINAVVLKSEELENKITKDLQVKN